MQYFYTVCFICISTDDEIREFIERHPFYWWPRELFECLGIEKLLVNRQNRTADLLQENFCNEHTYLRLYIVTVSFINNPLRADKYHCRSSDLCQ